MIATFETWRHHSAASPPVKGGLATERSGRAPRVESAVRNASTFARYCAFVSDHGVGVWAPKSSFSATIGVWQPVTPTA